MTGRTHGFLALAVAGLAAVSVACAHRQDVTESESEPPVLTARVSGDGPTQVILVPGLAGGDVAWAGTVRRLQSTHRLHEIRIAGLAGNPGRGPESIDALARALAEYLRERVREQAIVVAHSAGGVAALALAVDHPELVSRVIVVDALPFMSANAGSDEVSDALRETVATDALAIASETASAFSARMESQAASAVGSQTLAKQIASSSVRGDRQTYGALYGDLMLTDLRPRLARLRVPLFVIFADQSPHGAPAGHMRRRYESQYDGTDAQLLEVQDARHYLMLDQPDDFAAALSASLE